jgi:metal-dependent HD superfamily phosphatase/phosphodiesterase
MTEIQPVLTLAPSAPGILFDDVRRDPQALAFIRTANQQLAVLGYTEHGERHATLVGHISRNILARLSFPPRSAELAAIAGFLHDIGNVVRRRDHPQSSAFIALDILKRLGMPFEELALVLGAVGNHEEEMGDPVSEISAAVIIADKSDVHRSRVQNPDKMTFDIHDRVNFAAQRSFVRVDAERKAIALEIDIDTSAVAVIDYFEIFMSRMLMSHKAAHTLGCQFELIINKTRLL